MNQTKISPARYSTGGRTNIGSNYLTAVNQSAQYGYVYATARGVGDARLYHAPRANTNNWCSWTFSSYVQGQLWVQGTVNY